MDHKLVVVLLAAEATTLVVQLSMLFRQRTEMPFNPTHIHTFLHIRQDCADGLEGVIELSWGFDRIVDRYALLFHVTKRHLCQNQRCRLPGSRAAALGCRIREIVEGNAICLAEAWGEGWLDKEPIA